jgi:hypothetical protein
MDAIILTGADRPELSTAGKFKTLPGIQFGVKKGENRPRPLIKCPFCHPEEPKATKDLINNTALLAFIQW